MAKTLLCLARQWGSLALLCSFDLVGNSYVISESLFVIDCPAQARYLGGYLFQTTG